MWRHTVVRFVQSGYSWQDACRGAYMQLFHIVLPPVPYKPALAPTTGVYVLRVGAPGHTPLQAQLDSRAQDLAHREAIAREVEEIVTQTPTYRPQAVHLAPLAPPVEEVRYVSSSSSEIEKADPLDRTEKYPALAALRHSA
jgi:hypothetical protein